MATVFFFNSLFGFLIILTIFHHSYGVLIFNRTIIENFIFLFSFKSFFLFLIVFFLRMIISLTYELTIVCRTFWVSFDGINSIRNCCLLTLENVFIRFVDVFDIFKWRVEFQNNLEYIKKNYNHPRFRLWLMDVNKNHK